MALKLQIVVTDQRIPFLNSFTKTVDYTLPPLPGFLSSSETLLESIAIGKSVTGTLLIEVDAEDDLVESLTVNDTLGLGIPAALAEFSAQQKLAPIIATAIKEIEPNGASLTIVVTVVSA